MPFGAIRGFKDILPLDARRWELVEDIARGVFNSFGFEEMRIPLLEKTEVFEKGIGQHTDIVEKEMYTFTDKNGESVTIRPEATAGVLRSVIEHKLYNQKPNLKLFTIGPMFRHERPQKGRLRQFHQINAETIGSDEALSDAEIIWIVWDLLKELEIDDIKLEINSLGCPECRPLHREDLLIYIENKIDVLCSDCKRRSKTNPLRLFDCKHEQCKAVMKRAPLIKHYLCPECAGHLGKVLDYLEAIGIPFVSNPYLVRGLDYYVRTTFEIVSSSLGAQGTVAAGGRYNGLIRDMGGPDIPGVGMAIGVERLLLLLKNDPSLFPTDLFVAALGKQARGKVLPWIRDLRRMDFSVQMSYSDAGLKAQLKQADRLNARFVIIVGENELEKKELILRDMETHEQENVPLDNVVESIAKFLDEEEYA